MTVRTLLSSTGEQFLINYQDVSRPKKGMCLSRRSSWKLDVTLIFRRLMVPHRSSSRSKMGMCQSRNNWLKLVETLKFRKRMGVHPSTSRTLTLSISIRQEVADWRSLSLLNIDLLQIKDGWTPIYVVHHGRDVPRPQMGMRPSQRSWLKLTVTNY